MCGIVGYIGDSPSGPILMDGLRRLEYRGYDSAGLAVLDDDGDIGVVRAVGKLANLEAALREKPLDGTVGIGHTRWATHGRPSEPNAHPHLVDGVAVVHNGIIENHLALHRRLLEQGREFSSDTDTEIVSHLVAGKIAEGNDLETAVRLALR
ncbi:MAG: glutamine--fructose-6-phosphate aminotransferase, partial [Polyangiales bacterium]